MKQDYHQSYVWPLWLRLSHWVMALCALILLVTGWFLGSGMVVNELLVEALRGVHVPAGQLLAAALAVRLVMLFVDTGVGGWRALEVTREGAQSALEMFRFYLAFGRRRLPGFFAHDPLWKLLYPAFYILLLAQTLSGLGLEYSAMRQVLRLGSDILDSWHSAGAWLVAWVAGLHIASVMLRELRSQGYEVSAMLHGHKLFRVDKSEFPETQLKPQSGVSVKLDLTGKDKR